MTISEQQKERDMAIIIAMLRVSSPQVVKQFHDILTGKAEVPKKIHSSMQREDDAE